VLEVVDQYRLPALSHSRRASLKTRSLRLLSHVPSSRVQVPQRRDHPAVAMIAADELASLMETAHLLRSPANAERLLSALARARQGKSKPKTVDALRRAVLRDPFSGVGKPEPLKYLGSDVWSRRLTQEHRCVYVVNKERVDFLQGRYHY